MNIKKLTLTKYLLKTVILAAPGGIVMGYIAKSSFDSVTGATIFSCIAAALLGIAISAKNYLQLIAPMKTVISELNDVISKSKIEGIKDVKTIDNIRQGFMLVLNNLTSNLKQMTAKIETASGEIIRHSELLASGAVETATSINQVSANIQQVNSNLQHISESANKTAVYAEDGKAGVERIVSQMESIKEATGASGQVVNSLNESSVRITQIVGLITQIAEQTNLLALNAAIEAARAGEHGRGFAVVAEEVRGLAEQSAKASGEIHELISQIQQRTNQAVQAMSEGAGQVEVGSVVAKEVGATFKKIITAVQDFAGEIKSMAAAAEEISSAIQNVTATAEEQSAAVDEFASTILTLNDLTRELDNLGKRFEI